MTKEIGAVTGYPDEMIAAVVNALAFDAFGDAYTDTQRVLDALRSAGWLVPPGSEVREEHAAQLVSRVSGKVEHRLIGAAKWEIDEFVTFYEPSRWKPSTVKRQVIRTPWSPSVPDTKEET